VQKPTVRELSCGSIPSLHEGTSGYLGDDVRDIRDIRDMNESGNRDWMNMTLGIQGNLKGESTVYFGGRELPSWEPRWAVLTVLPTNFLNPNWAGRFDCIDIGSRQVKASTLSMFMNCTIPTGQLGWSMQTFRRHGIALPHYSVFEVRRRGPDAAPASSHSGCDIEKVYTRSKISIQQGIDSKGHLPINCVCCQSLGICPLHWPSSLHLLVLSN
jgi:hypothetical protein